MIIRTFSDATDLARALASRLAAILRAQPRLVLGLPTGRTPLRLYQELAWLHARGEIDFGTATSFNLDEFAGLAPDHPSSYRSWMEHEFFRHVNLPIERRHFLRGAADDLDAECARYDEAIAAAGGLDLLLLGLGVNGHVAFNEPGDALVAPSHQAVLLPETRDANRGLFGDAPVPRCGLTMGMAAILQAKKIVLLATGTAKRDAVGGMVQGKVTTRLPASFLQLHCDAEVWVDEDAAGGLSRP